MKETTSTKPENGYALGDTISYKITVTNDGNLTISDITLTDTVKGYEPVDITSKLDKTELKPGEEATATFEHVVTEQDILAGTVANEAVVKGKDPEGKDPDPKPGTTDDPTEDVNVTMPVTKTISNKPADGKAFKLGETIEYTITVKNDGNVTYKNVAVNDKITGLQETIATLGVGETKTFTTSYVVTEKDILAGVFENTVVAEGNPVPDPKDPDNPKVPAGEDTESTGTKDDPDNPNPPIEDPNPHMNVVKTTTSTPAVEKGYKLGEEISYEITVTNDGNLSLTDLVVTDELTGDEWTIPSLAVGAKETFTTSYVVTEDDILAGKVLNEATATGKGPEGKDPDPTPGTKEDPTDPKNGHLTITKETTSKPAYDGVYTLGETITYKITATNDGNLTLTDVVVTDELTGDRWTVASLAPGASQTFNARHTVTEADVAAGKVVNVATGDGISPDPDKPKPEIVPGTKEDPVVSNYTLTIEYRYYTTQRTAAPTVTMTLAAGEPYNVASPSIDGYRASLGTVAGTLTRDTTIVVFYVRSGGGTPVTPVIPGGPVVPGVPADDGLIVIDDFETPLGLGGVYSNLGDCFE